jgi:hypothetical protein
MNDVTFSFGAESDEYTLACVMKALEGRTVIITPLDAAGFLRQVRGFVTRVSDGFISVRNSVGNHMHVEIVPLLEVVHVHVH